MNRRTFVSTLTSTLAICATQKLFANEKPKLTIDQIEIKAGLKNPLKFLHISDSHILCWSDEVEDQEKLLSYRKRAFGKSSEYYRQAIEFSKKNNAPILNTGDVYDFFNSESLKFLKNDVISTNFVYAVGNHEFSRYCGSKPEIEGTPDMVLALEKSIGYDVWFSSRIIGGLNIIAMNDTNYQFNEYQMKRLQEEIARGLPILAMFHIPLYTEKFYADSFSKKRNCAFLVGVPKDKLSTYPEKRRVAHTPTATTLKVAEILRTEPLIKGIICGHIHKTISETLPSGGVQATVKGGYLGGAQFVSIV